MRQIQRVGTRSNIRRPSAATALMAVVLFIPWMGTAIIHAQSESEIRQLSARQTQQIKDLNAEVEALQTRVRALESRLEALDLLIERLHGAKAPEEVAPKAPESIPPKTVQTAPAATRPETVFESPASVVEALRWDFRNALTKDPSFALGIDSVRERARQEAASTLDSWLQRMNRLYREPIIWSARILEQDTIDETRTLTLQGLNPDGIDAGAPFKVAITNAISRRITRWQEQGDLKSLLVKGTFEPVLTAIRSDEEPPEDAAPSTRIEISPYVGLDYTVRVSSIMPVFVKDGEPDGDGS